MADPSRRPRSGGRGPRSLRVRVTAVVTGAVGIALALASFLLVGTMERTLIGEARAAAEAEVDRVAGELERGRTPSEGDWTSLPMTMIRIRRPDGRVVGTIPDTAGAGNQNQTPGDETPGDEIPGGEIPEERLSAERSERGTAEGAEGVGEPASGDTDGSGEDLVVASRTVSTPEGPRTVVAVSRIAQATQSVDLVVNSLLLATPVLTLVVGALAWFAVDRSLQPIETVRRRAEAISHSTMSERLPGPGTGDEVERLTATLNEMLDRLDEGARRQREFVSDASHELRTPLATIRADLEVSLAHPERSDWPVLAERLRDDHRRLERLTDDLLLLARSDDGTVAERAPVRLDELVAGELPGDAGPEVSASLEPVEVVSAAGELERVVRNLVENAVAYARARIDVRLAVEAGTIVLRVDDDGPGIPEDQRERAFERFVRLDASRDRSSGGTGLGLALARRIARGHGGDITIASSPWGGARFEVRLPASDAGVGHDGP